MSNERSHRNHGRGSRNGKPRRRRDDKERAPGQTRRRGTGREEGARGSREQTGAGTKHPKKPKPSKADVPRMVYANERGEIFDDPDTRMAGAEGDLFVEVDPAHLIPLPPGSDLLVLPGRHPVGFHRGLNVFQDRVAVAAFLAPAYTRYLGPAFTRDEDAPLLPLYAYTAVGWKDGRFWVPAVRVDQDVRQDPEGFDPDELLRRVQERLAGPDGDNRLVQHLADCALERQCPAAKNYFLGRWEAPLPTSPRCNARCIGCISAQPGDRTQTFGRIPFEPTPEEIAGVAVPHLEHAPSPVVSFGQGCEGEPLVVAPLLEEAIRVIRSRTSKGVVNLNTNGSRPDWVARLCHAGLQAIRVSLPAALPEIYDIYTKPSGFTYQDVVRSLEVAHDAGVFTSINYFVFPGVSDREAEVDALLELCRRGVVDLIQLRNLNIDPDLYLSELGDVDRFGEPIGVPALISRLSEEVPWVRHGYFNPHDLTRLPRSGQA